MANTQPTNERVEQIAAVGFMTIGWTPRETDFRMMELLAKACQTEDEVIKETAKYCWDHLMGEPDEPTQAEIEAMIKVNLGRAA